MVENGASNTSARSPATEPPDGIATAPAWHAMATVEVLSAVGGAADEPGGAGLGEAEAARRLAVGGGNTVGEQRRERFWEELAESLREPLQLLLIVVAVLSAVFGEIRDAVAIGVIIVAVAVTETVTEQRAGRAIAALRRLSAPTARVRRDGRTRQILAAEVVTGDVFLIEAGDVVPSDARVLDGFGLRVDESALTGEAYPAGKGKDPAAAEAALAERTSMLYAGTVVSGGEGSAVVVATGADTELGRLGRLVATESEPPTPLQRALSRLARTVLVAALAASIVVPLVGLLSGQDPRVMLLAGLTLAFATIPEELPILITVLLAVGGRQLARRGALLRRLRSGETLGVVTTVVTDKTGTLTQNRLRLAHISGDETEVLTVALAAQPPRAEQTGREPIEVELAAAARRAGIHADDAPADVVYPFEPERRMTSRLHATADGLELAVAGAPEPVLAACELDRTDRDAITATVDRWTLGGLRVIAFARRRLGRTPQGRDDAEQALTYVGLAAFADPLRDGVPDAARELRAAGVATVVVSGDHPTTVEAIARSAELPPGHCLTGGEALGATGDTELSAELADGTVIGRATPQDKLRIVRLLQARGEVVAVTGDGVNDAPALAAADVGIAMGRRGSDLARQAAGLVLTDDAFPTVVAAIAKGRNIGSQLRRAVAFYLGAKLALVIIMLVALAAGRPIVFTPAAIVLLELFMDLGASVAFVAEPAAPGAMSRPPRPASAGFLDRATLGALGTTAAALILAVLPPYLILTGSGGDVGLGRAAAVFAWLAGHALIAWTLRARPTLSWRRNPAFPIWVVAAIAMAALVTATAVGGFAHLAHLTPRAAAIAGIAIAAGIALAAAGRVLLRTRTRL